LRPCFIGARATFAEADSLMADVLRIGGEIALLHPTRVAYHDRRSWQTHDDRTRGTHG
jgi:hypothetical protein